MQSMRYRLRTLLILLAVMPPLLWFGCERFSAWMEWRTVRQARKAWLLAMQRRATRQLAIFRLTRPAVQIQQISLPTTDSRGVVDPNTDLRPVPGERDYQFPPWQPSLKLRIDSFDEGPPPRPE